MWTYKQNEVKSRLFLMSFTVFIMCVNMSLTQGIGFFYTKNGLFSHYISCKPQEKTTRLKAKESCIHYLSYKIYQVTGQFLVCHFFSRKIAGHSNEFLSTFFSTSPSETYFWHPKAVLINKRQM